MMDDLFELNSTGKILWLIGNALIGAIAGPILELITGAEKLCSQSKQVRLSA